jgi:hypothetical protein
MLAAQLRLFPDEVKMVPTIHDSLWAQFVDWISFFFQYMMKIWSFEAQNPDSNYGPHLWTIPFKFRDSMILYVSVQGAVALRPNLFWLVTMVPLAFCLIAGKWYVVLFLVGMVLANSIDRPRLVSPRGKIKVVLEMAAFFFGLYLTQRGQHQHR